VEAVGRPDEDPDALDLADPVLSDHRRLTFFGYLAFVTSWLRGRPLESTHLRVAKQTPGGSSMNPWRTPRSHGDVTLRVTVLRSLGLMATSPYGPVAAQWRGPPRTAPGDRRPGGNSGPSAQRRRCIPRACAGPYAGSETRC